MPTSLGVKAALFYVVLAGAFLAAPYSNLYFLLLAFLTALGGLNVLWTVRNLAGACAEAGEAEPVPAGAGMPWAARIDAGRSTRYALEVVLAIEGRGRVTARVPVARGTVEATGRLPALPRGIHRVTSATLESSWPLGLLRARHRIPAFEELVVYPAPADIPESRSGTGALGELLGAWCSSAGFLQPSGLREYLPGDELRHVHWKASARRGELVITEWEGGLGSGIEVVLDRRTDEETLEESLSLLTAMALAAREDKELLTLHSQGLSASFGSERRPFKELLRFLAGAETLPDTAPGPPPVSPGVIRLPAASAPGGPA